MGLLESLSMGLRSAGGIMDEGVYKGQRQEDLVMQQLQEKRRDLMAQQVIKAAESGAMPPEVAQQALQQIGYKGMQVGPDAATQQRQEEVKRRNEISKAFGTLAPEDRSNPLKVADIFLAHGDHASGINFLNKAEERQERRQQVLLTLEQRQREAEMRSDDRTLTREAQEQARREANELKRLYIEGMQQHQRDSLELRRAMGAVAASNRQPPQPQIVQTENGPVQVDREGNARPITINGQPVKPAPRAGDHLTEAEGKGTLFYRQMKSANDTIDTIVGPDFDVTKVGNQVATRMAGSDLTNWLAPAKAQQYAQSTEQWAEAYLRLKTGAATTKDEVRRNARSYFPQPGDSKDVIDQKNTMRRQAEADVAVVAGRGMNKPSESAPKKVSSEAEYNALPSGAQYIAPDGSTRRKK